MSDPGTSLIGDIPPELWFIIFWFVLGPEPFGKEEHRTYNCLRGVCTAWKRIATTSPGLCSGFELDRASWAVPFKKEVIKAWVAPWLAIIRHNSYHLRVSASWDNLEDEESKFLARYLLCDAAPTPTSLTVGSSTVFQSILSMAERCESVTAFNFTCPSENLDDVDIVRLPLVLPKLQSFSSDARMAFHNPFNYPNLRSLVLLDIVGSSEDFARLVCMRLPCLQELKISSENIYEFVEPFAPLDTPLIHSNLEIVLVVGEDVLPLLAHLALPSLKFFGLEAWGMQKGGEVLEQTLPAFFQRSQLSNLRVSLKGCCRKSLFAALTCNLPPTITFLANLGLVWREYADEDYYDDTISYTFDFNHFKEMVCLDLRWLQKIIDRVTCNQAVKIYAPTDSLEKGQMQLTTQDMREKGFELKLLSPAEMESMLSSVMPQMSIEWKG
ncbi:hypothetical protein BKA70DRAFT_1435717 [Coprinopsis sp. MPI-PUGE-AT-0042]|nr:hypothetical protein BKA70DRAFT_1435717 [Coprinopsis sp. MPI-PUGE-AT-0042]